MNHCRDEGDNVYEKDLSETTSLARASALRECAITYAMSVQLRKCFEGVCNCEPILVHGRALPEHVQQGLQRLLQFGRTSALNNTSVPSRWHADAAWIDNERQTRLISMCTVINSSSMRRLIFTEISYCTNS